MEGHFVDDVGDEARSNTGRPRLPSRPSLATVIEGHILVPSAVRSSAHGAFVDVWSQI